jgi:hypothetical protein
MKMFYKQRNIIYGITLILATILAYLIGKYTVTDEVIPSPKATTTAPFCTSSPAVIPTLEPTVNIFTAATPAQTHKNYDIPLTIKGEGYEFTYSISNLTLHKTNNTISYAINTIKSTNVKTFSIWVYDVVKNNYDTSLIKESSTATRQMYTTKLIPGIRELAIRVYPLTEEASKIDDLDMNKLPSEDTNISLDALKRQP